MERTPRLPTPAGPGVDRLSGRERQVVQMLGRGLSNRQIAERLFRSVKTIETHKQRARQKLDLPSALALAQFAGRLAEATDAVESIRQNPLSPATGATAPPAPAG